MKSLSARISKLKFLRSDKLDKSGMIFLRRPDAWFLRKSMFVCVEVLRPSQPGGVMSSAVSLPNHTFTGQA